MMKEKWLAEKLDEKGCRGAPDRIVDPEKELAMIYRLEKEVVEQYSSGEEIPVGI